MGISCASNVLAKILPDNVQNLSSDSFISWYYSRQIDLNPN